MNEDRSKALNRIVRAYRAGRALVVFFDYDGTLTPLVDHPSRAVLGAATRAVLERLSQLPRVAVGVLSGRLLADLRGMVDLPGLYYAGTGGMEIDLRGRTLRDPGEGEGAELLEPVARHLEELLAQWPGAWIERKGAALTIHYRAVRTDRLKELPASLERALAPWRSRIRATEGPMALEVAPKDAWTKAEAVRSILSDAGPDAAFPVYVGDEANDAEAFEVVAARDGVTIGVGPEAPDAAEYRLPDTGAVEEWLRALVESLAGPPAPSRDGTKRG